MPVKQVVTVIKPTYLKDPKFSDKLKQELDNINKQKAKQVEQIISYKHISKQELDHIINNGTEDITIEMDSDEFYEMKMRECDNYIASVSDGLIEFVHQYKEMKKILDKQKLASEKRKATIANKNLRSTKK
jgi:hypothetical protein